MKRRTFIKNSGLAAATLPLYLNGVQLSASMNGSFLKLLNPENDKIIVLIQMNGGNDGLNTVIPVEYYDNLANARNNILIPQNSILNLNDKTGLHPAMTGIKSLFDDGKINIVQNVGYPNQNRSHFRSSDIWTSASESNEFLSSGWLGRFFENHYRGFPDGYPNLRNTDPIALTMGSILSETCQGTVSNFSLALTDPYALNTLFEADGEEIPDNYYGRELAFLRTSIAQTNKYTDVILGAAKHGSNSVAYPDTRLAEQLKNVALMISGGLETKVYVCNIGGFDTHANQIQSGDSLLGRHTELLQELSDAVLAFQQDIENQNLDKRVLGMTFSEFGRQIKSNYSDGTDHGDAAPVILFGSCVNAGIQGENPVIESDIPNQAGVPMDFDFRNLYGAVLNDWFEVDNKEIKEILFDGYTYHALLSPCQSWNKQDVKHLQNSKPVITASAFPNPFKDEVNFNFECKNEHVQLSLVDINGKTIENIVDKSLSAGKHSIRYDGRNLTPGNYYYRLRLGDGVESKMIVKL